MLSPARPLAHLPPQVRKIFEEVCAETGVSIEEIRRADCKRPGVEARRMCIVRLRDETVPSGGRRTWKQIAEYIGCCDEVVRHHYKRSKMVADPRYWRPDEDGILLGARRGETTLEAAAAAVGRTVNAARKRLAQLEGRVKPRGAKAHAAVVS